MGLLYLYLSSYLYGLIVLLRVNGGKPISLKSINRLFCVMESQFFLCGKKWIFADH